jgi:hypothetical protein
MGTIYKKKGDKREMGRRDKGSNEEANMIKVHYIHV